MSSAVNVFVHAVHKRLQKVGYLGSLGPIPMIQPPFCSSCVALQYGPGTKFFYPELNINEKLHPKEASRKLKRPSRRFRCPDSLACPIKIQGYSIIVCHTLDTIIHMVHIVRDIEG